MKKELLKINFILERFFNEWKMDVNVFDQDDHVIVCYRTSINQPLSTMRGTCKNAGMPVIQMEKDGIYYIAFCDKEDRLFLFGPASTEDLSFAQQVSFRKRHYVSNQKYQVPKVSFSKSLNGVALVYYMLTGCQITEEAILKSSEIDMNANVAPEEMMSYEVQNTTEEKQHLAYQDELKWTMAIENGILENKEKRMTAENLEKVDQIGTLANSNSLKQFEYMAVTASCLASRAAIRGGINAYEAYRTSEMFLQKISKCTNVMEILQIHLEISQTFSDMVRAVKENHNSDCVEQCKDYMARHRTEKFSLNEVADAVGKNPNYLSRVFSEQTGMTMQEYALNTRLEAAANMLKFSNEAIGEVAEYLSFPSQSYFGERFKKKYGVTPATYRKQHKIRDFKE